MRIPPWVRHPTDFDADRLMLAAWLATQGGDADEVATAIVRSILPSSLLPRMDLTRAQLDEKLTEIAEELGKADQTSCVRSLDEVQRFAYTEYGIERLNDPEQWAIDQHEQLIADVRVHAEALVHRGQAQRQAELRRRLVGLAGTR